MRFRSIKITGKAASFGIPFWSGERGSFVTWSAGCFAETIRRLPDQFQLRIDHLPITIPTVGPVELSARNGGLRIAAGIDLSKPIGRAAAIAVQHGWLSGLSVGVRIVEYAVCGGVHVATRTIIDEISLTNSPRDVTARAAVAGCEPCRTPQWPTDPLETAILSRFLRDCGLATDLPKPTTAAVAKPSKPVAKPATKSVAKPVAVPVAKPPKVAAVPTMTRIVAGGVVEFVKPPSPEVDEFRRQMFAECLTSRMLSRFTFQTL